MKQDKQPVTKAQLEWLQKQKICYQTFMVASIRKLHA